MPSESARPACLALIITAGVVFLGATSSQASTWIRDYDLGTNVVLGPVAGLPDGSIILVADGQRGLGSWDTSIVRLDAAGRVLQHQVRGTGLGDRISEVDVAADGSLLLTGWTSFYGGLLERYRADGRLEWARLVEEGANEDLSLAASTPAGGGGWFTGGSYTSPPEPGCDPWLQPCERLAVSLLRLDARGRVEWALAHDAGGNETLRRIEGRSDGGAILAVGENLAMSVAGDGSPEWTLRLGAAAAACAGGSTLPLRKIIPTRDGGYLACGGGSSCGVERAWVVKLTSDGSAVWERHDEWTSRTQIPQWGWGSVIELDDGRIAVQGRALLALLGPDGSEQWARHFPYADHAWSHTGSLAAAGGDLVVDWLLTTGLARVGPEGDIGATPCFPWQSVSLPGGLVSPSSIEPVSVTTRAASATSRLVALGELTFCADPRCAELCSGGETDCADGIDDDDDGFLDCDDADCSGSPACDVDTDGDGARDHVDALPDDPGVRSVPRPILTLLRRDPVSGDLVINWEDQAAEAGVDTRQDVVRGSLADFSTGECIARDVDGDGVVDPPGAAPGAWYLVRAQNAAGTAGFGGLMEGPGPCD